MRGGTALHKLYYSKPIRYSEDIDLVLLNRDQKKPTLEKLEKVVEAILGEKVDKTPPGRSSFSLQLFYSFEPTSDNWDGNENKQTWIQLVSATVS
jgi:predicted nucleotidyltransferase component of viral defense system